MELEDDWATFQPDALKRSLRHADRTPFIRPVRYNVSPPYDMLRSTSHCQTALSVNFGPGGLCMLTDDAPLLVPHTAVYLSGVSADGRAMVLGEVRWVRTLPQRFKDPCLVGIKVGSWIPGEA